MKLYERFAEKNFHTSVATTFGIDFDAYESIVLSRLRGAGCRNNMVITDSRMLTYALGGASELPQHAGTHYTVSGARAAGVFHPKVFLQFGRRAGRLIISSANLTPSGLAGNLELANEIRCDDDDSGEQRLIAQAWAHVGALLDKERESVAGQGEWMQARTRWLDDAVPADSPVWLADGTQAALLTTGPSRGIAARFADLIEESVSRLIVISPYWDRDLAALNHLIARLSPDDVSLVIDPKTREFPKDAVTGRNIKLYNRGSFHEGRFIHAKAVIAETKNADHTLLGSANCTRAALGVENYAGSNEEVCLYRRLPPDSVLAALGLDDVLIDDFRIEPMTLDTPVFTEEIPFDELGQTAPGQFECRADTLLWYPPAIDDPHGCTLTLLDRGGLPIDCALTALPGKDEPLRYQIIGTETRPSLARIRFPDGRISGPAIVTAMDTLRLEIREPRSSGTQRKLDELESDTEAHLALLEVINELEALESSESNGPLSIPRRRREGSGNSDPSRYRQLSYEDFIKDRRPRTAGTQAAHDSLVGSDVSIVRGVLNRIIGLNAADGVRDCDGKHEDAAQHLLYRGDETSNPEGDINAGHEFTPEKREPTKPESDEEKHRRRAMRRRATQDQIVTAVKNFHDRIKANRANGDGLTKNDLLRLRALLMVLCTAASPKAKGKESEKELRSGLRVLPAEGDENSWPLLVGRLLFLFFGGNNPAIRQLHLTAEHDQIPGDFTECWATCYWCVQACRLGPPSKSEQDRLRKRLLPIAAIAFKLTLPSKGELLGDDVMKVMGRMSATYAAQLGLNPSAIEDGHRRMVAKVFTNP